MTQFNVLVLSSLNELSYICSTFKNQLKRFMDFPYVNMVQILALHFDIFIKSQ